MKWLRDTALNENIQEIIQAKSKHAFQEALWGDIHFV